MVDGGAAVGVEERQRVLAKSELFGGLAGEDLVLLAHAATPRAVRRGEEVFRKGDPGSELFVVARGLLKAQTKGEGAASVVFDLISPGEAFGEVALLGHTPRTASVAAVEPCLLLALEGGRVLDLMERRPAVAMRVLQAQLARVRRLSTRIEDSRFLRTGYRLAKQLAILSVEHGRAHGDGVRVDLRLSQTDLAGIVGASRETVNQQLRLWRDEGLIALEPEGIVILRPDELDALVRGAAL